jgi:hypothetical protein
MDVDGVKCELKPDPVFTFQSSRKGLSAKRGDVVRWNVAIVYRLVYT